MEVMTNSDPIDRIPKCGLSILTAKHAVCDRVADYSGRRYRGSESVLLATKTAEPIDRTSNSRIPFLNEGENIFDVLLTLAIVPWRDLALADIVRGPSSF